MHHSVKEGRVRQAPLLVGLTVALLVAFFFGISLGTATVPLGEVWDVIGTHLGWSDSVISPARNQIIWDFRTSRVILAATVGAALSLSGGCLQVLARNGLADPYILGVSSGSGLGAVIALTFGGTVLGGFGVSASAFIMSVATLLIVLSFAQQGGQIGPTRLVLAGVAVSYLATSLTTFIQLYSDPLAIRGSMYWILGSLQNARWDDLGIPGAAIVVGSVWLLVRARSLNILATGDESAVTLGVDVNRLRVELLVVSSLLTATAVSVAGGIGFVGLIIPHAARFLVGPDHRRMLPVAALSGSVFLVVVDLASRLVDRPNELPVGVFTSAVGAPFFLFLMRRKSRDVA